MTQDRLPHAGEHDGLYLFHGLQRPRHADVDAHGPAMAAVMGGDRDANPWADMEWPAIKGHFGPPWFLPLVGAYYKLQDRLH